MDMRSLLTLSVLLALIKEDKGQKPEVMLLPKFPQVYTGDDVTLKCPGGGANTKWLFNNKQLPSQDSLLLLTAVTVEDSGYYACEQPGLQIDPYLLTVLELEPHAQLSPTVGGAVMSKGDGRNLKLQVDDTLENWRCFVLRKDRGYAIIFPADEKATTAVIFAEFKDADRATYWCRKKDTSERSNAVTLKMTDRLVMLDPPAIPPLQGEPLAIRCVVWGGRAESGKVQFRKDGQEIQGATSDTYVIKNATQTDNGNYSCHATYRYSHIRPDAAEKEGDSDGQIIKVIGGPPTAIVSLEYGNVLQCSCPHCPETCTSYHWYHTPINNKLNERRKLLTNEETLIIEDVGDYSCRKRCENGFSRFGNIHITKEVKSESNSPIVALLVFLVLVIILLSAMLFMCKKRMKRNVEMTEQDKDKKTGGDYEQLGLSDRAVYHTLGQSTDQDKAEGGYEALQKKKDEAVYHTLGSGEGQAQAEGQGGYEALKNVKVEVYQTLGSGEGDSEKKAEEAEEGYEQLQR